jgi:PIN domain nuclease of toxin-antitoxin system
MKLLLDTHVLLWAALGELDGEAEALVEDESNELYFSSASIWEVVIKNALRREDFAYNPMALYRGLKLNGYIEVPVISSHVLRVGVLPDIHKDPFDRILVAQSTVEDLTLVTADKTVAHYSDNIMLMNREAIFTEKIS